jgi:hypothetical protein
MVTNDRLVENYSLIYHRAMATSTALPAAVGDSTPSAATKSRSLLAACPYPRAHDGYIDGLSATALLIAATLLTSLTPTLVLLPLLGIVLNGTLRCSTEPCRSFPMAIRAGPSRSFIRA